MKQTFFQAPEFLSLPRFGLSISQTSIRVAKLKKNKVGMIPETIDELKLEEACIFFDNPDEYVECPALKNALTVLKKKHKINFVQLSIPEEHTYVFTINIPGNDVDTVPDFILNNIDQNIPLAAQEVYFDYKVLDNKKTETNMPVIVTAIPKIIVEKYTQIIASAGILVVACEPETHAIARSVITHGDNNPYIIINVERYGTNISVVEDGFVQYTQTLPIYTKDIVTVLNSKSAQALKESISKVIIYWFTSKDNSVQHSKIENIILTGEGVDTSDIVNFLESNLFVNVTCANVWKNCFDLKEYIPEISRSESMRYATCIGLSMFKIK
jgi:Tfp pilus assembly PilM family ATPase